MAKGITINEMLRGAQAEGLSLGQWTIKSQVEALEVSETDLRERMELNLQVMRHSALEGLTGKRRSMSGLVGGDAKRLEERRLTGQSLAGDVMARVAARALAVAEVNAGMGKIVAAPTAGSCGVLPAVLLTVAEETGADDGRLVEALFAASGIGIVIATQASVSGAQGGCQAECGSAACMAAVAAVELAGGDAERAVHAGAMALKTLLGLVCDPVAGLVEVPCVKRNVTAAVNALIAADMALAGIKSNIPLDEVIVAMEQIGSAMPCALKETAQGGLAITPTALRVKEEFLGTGQDKE
ncbi:MAG TPA: L-serine ammonia-lyase, iron-sulfur-dependent, subunit alpha [Verrucomicrobiae bacterium]|nr:L-serine ammonia-lyase, iron-sulfur-dependent, subunit alpha [Verrucomicrobiae bacterium]